MGIHDVKQWAEDRCVDGSLERSNARIVLEFNHEFLQGKFGRKRAGQTVTFQGQHSAANNTLVTMSNWVAATLDCS